MAPATDTFTLNVMGLDITVTRATTPDAAPVVQIDSAGVPEDADTQCPMIRVYVNDGCVYEGAKYISESEVDEACECANDPVPGACWPIQTNGDGAHDWVERCDLCGVFDSDGEAAAAVSAHTGLMVGWDVPDGCNGLHPFVNGGTHT